MTMAKTEMTKLPECQQNSMLRRIQRLDPTDVTHQDHACTALTMGFILAAGSNRVARGVWGRYSSTADAVASES